MNEAHKALSQRLQTLIYGIEDSEVIQCLQQFYINATSDSVHWWGHCVRLIEQVEKICYRNSRNRQNAELL